MSLVTNIMSQLRINSVILDYDKVKRVVESFAASQKLAVAIMKHLQVEWDDHASQMHHVLLRHQTFVMRDDLTNPDQVILELYANPAKRALPMGMVPYSRVPLVFKHNVLIAYR